mgnify:CR=1 FL=1
MFLRNDHGLEFAGGASVRSTVVSAPRPFGRAALPEPSRIDRLRAQFATIDWVPDLGKDMGGAIKGFKVDLASGEGR